MAVNRKEIIVTIQTWLNRNLAKRLVLLVLFTLVFQLLIFSLLIYNTHQRREQAIENAAIFFGVNYDRRNRINLVTQANLLKTSYKADLIAICDSNDRVVWNHFGYIKKCNTPDSYFDIRIKKRIFGGTDFLYLIVRFSALHYLVILLPFLVSFPIFFLLLLGIILSFYSRVKNDIVDPIQTLLQEKATPKIEELGKLKDNIHSLTSQLKEQSRLAAIAQVTQVLAHDIRKPFSQMQLLLNSFDRISTDPSAFFKAKRSVKKSILHVNGMLNDIMNTSRKVTLETRPVSLPPVLNYAIRQSLKEYTSYSIKISYALSANKKPLLDEERMARALINILCNAAEAITVMGQRQSGQIDIVSKNGKENTNTLEIIIGNNGPIFEQGTIEKLFDYFYTSGKSKGTGLGLVSASKTLSLHNGQISARNRVDHAGVEFVLTLPVSEEPENNDITILPSNSVEINNPFTDETNILQISRQIELKQDLYRVLLLEDEALYRAGVKDLISLDSTLSNKVILYDASSVKDAMSLLTHQKIEYAIIDIDLNDEQNGYDFLEIAKKKHPNISFLIHSNRFYDQNSEKAQELGVFGFAPKPLSLAHFIYFINHIPFDTLPIFGGGEFKRPVKAVQLKKTKQLSEHLEISLLIIDDDPYTAEYLKDSVTQFLCDISINLRISSVNTYQQSIKMLESSENRFTHVFSDLNIDSNRDGLLIAEKVQELNKHRANSTEFYIMTNADTDELNNSVSPEKVKKFYMHPVDSSVFKEIFREKNQKHRM